MLLMLCILMQSVMLFPHHHHPDRSGVCMNLFHCTEAHTDCRDHSGRSCGTHTHDMAENHCGFSTLVFSQPQREDFSSLWQTFEDGDAGFAVWTLPVVEETEQRRAEIPAFEYECPVITSLHLLYITQASLLRAPTRLA